MNRRRFLIQASAAASLNSFASVLHADDVAPVQLTISDDSSAPEVPLTYTGLSYELAQLTDPHFFSAENRDLVSYFRLLSPNGVLRIGGNTSEFCWFKANASTTEPRLHIPSGNLDANWMPHRLFAITPEAIDALAGFLQATGWRLIYGLNFGNSTPERAAEEAANVMQKAGDHLEFFQIGNEPDFYHDANNGTRPAAWGFSDYITEWLQTANAITVRVPGARFGGPDVGASSDWVTRFAEGASASGPQLFALTGHYYAEGPPNDPRVTTERLLAGNVGIPAQMKAIEDAARPKGLVYRMTEGNSCYRGGKPGMSNAFASALWAGDYMLQLASLGCAGVNLHGGSSAFLSAGLGDHTPGLEAAKTPQTMRSGFYTPIATEPGRAIQAMPIFYGMLLANQFAGGKFLQVTANLRDVNATAYAVRFRQSMKIAIFNKDSHKSVEVSIRAPGIIKSATAWRLDAPALDATDGVTLARAAILAHGEWHPGAPEPVAITDGAPHIQVRAGSAVLVFLA
ncbi:MAG: glycosyl hydrolase family 79 C-terminal domain-containing protein [Terracidiphilus sp.]|jgi:hypothetical protein